MRTDKVQEAKINQLCSDIEGMASELAISDREAYLSYISSIICVFDTDIAIEVMERQGTEGKYQAMAIKVNYGY